MNPGKDKNGQSQLGKHEHPLANEISTEQRKTNERAHEEADRDMEEDVEFTSSSPNDDLDEGETARLGEDVPEII